MVDLKSFLPKREGKDQSEYFWSLLIEPGWVQAGIWKIEDKKAQVIITSNATHWEVEEDLASAADTSLSSAIQSFPEDLSEPSKTVFGVPANWVTEGAIGAEHLEKIKRICSELSLSPIGFVVLPEALAHYKKSTEGSPLNAITLGVYKDILEISVFSMGNLVGTSQVARSVAITDDVTEGLSRFSLGTSIPSRILLYDGREGELEEVRQALLRVNWEDFGNLKFLHTPKVEIVEIKNKVHAVSLAGASELAGVTSLEVTENFDVGGAKRLVSRPELVQKLGPKVSQEDNGGGETTDSVIEDFQDASGAEVTSAEELGFSMEKDVTEGGDDFTGESNTTSTDAEMNEPVVQMQKENRSPFKENQEDPSYEIDRVHDNVREVRRDNPLSKKIGSLKKGFLSFLGSVKLPKASGFSTGKNMFILGPVFLLVLALLGFLYWWFVPRATVTIYVSPQRLEERLELRVDTAGGSTDVGEGILEGEVVETSVSGEKTKDTTGTKTVGDKAKGEVTLYRVGPELELDAGTILNGPENLKFTLDSDTTIASGSAGSAGTTKANVMANDIGAQYNLAGGTSFTVSNYSTSDIEAKSEAAFSGGSSREINAVSEEDKDVLTDDLTKELSEQALAKLSSEMTNEKYFIDESLNASASASTFSAKAGDEATTLKLSMDVEARAVIVEKSVLNQFAKEFLDGKVPEGFVLREEQIEYNFEFGDEDDGVYEFDVRISANLLPEVNTEDIKKKMRGKFPNLAEEFLNKEVAGFVRAEIKIRPDLPAKLTTLPHLEKNIEVEVAAER